MKCSNKPTWCVISFGMVFSILCLVACEKNFIRTHDMDIEKSFKEQSDQITPTDMSLSGCSTAERPTVYARLIQVGTLSEAKLGMSVASAGSKILFAGASLRSVPGNDYPVYGTDIVEIFDIRTQILTSKRLSTTRSNVTAVNAGKKIFLAGGRLGDGAFDELFSNVDIYDVETDSWESSHLSVRRYNMGAGSIGNKVFFAGGVIDWDYNTSDKVDIYDLTSKSWTSTVLSLPRTNISAVAVDNKVYFGGGHEEDRWYSKPSKVIDVFNLTSQSWEVSSLFAPLGFLSGLYTGDKIYWSEECSFQVWDLKTSQSTEMNLTKPSLWNASTGQNMVMKDGKIILLKLHTPSNTFDIYDINTKTWSIGKLDQSIPIWASVISVNNTIYIAGGFNFEHAMDSPSRQSNKIWKLELIDLNINNLSNKHSAKIPNSQLKRVSFEN